MLVSPPRPLTVCILRYLDALQEPCHYALLAQVLHRSVEKVQRACWHLTRHGRLTRASPGHYAIPACGVAVSQAASRPV